MADKRAKHPSRETKCGAEHRRLGEVFPKSTIQKVHSFSVRNETKTNLDNPHKCERTTRNVTAEKAPQTYAF